MPLEKKNLLPKFPPPRHLPSLLSLSLLPRGASFLPSSALSRSCVVLPPPPLPPRHSLSLALV
jgi:hypothetical protein